MWGEAEVGKCRILSSFFGFFMKVANCWRTKQDVEFLWFSDKFCNYFDKREKTYRGNRSGFECQPEECIGRWIVCGYGNNCGENSDENPQINDCGKWSTISSL